MDSNSPQKIIITACTIYILGLIFFIFWISQFFDLTFTEFLKQYKGMLVLPNMNKFIVGEIKSKNVMLLLYWFCGFSCLLSAFYCYVFARSPNSKNDFTLNHFLTYSLLACLFSFAIIQQFNRYDFYAHERGMIAGKSVHEIHEARFGGLYQFPKATGDALKKRIQAKIVTDHDLKKSPYMFQHRALSYFFYPKVSLRYNNGTPDIGLFLYAKENYQAHVPEGFSVISSSKDNQFVFALGEHH